MINERIYTFAATAAGGCLALMVLINGILSRYTNPFFSSLIVHVAGLAGSFILWLIINSHRKGILFSKEAPLWAYTGGVAGSLTVVISNIVVNSPLGLAGSLSCLILGQTSAALLFDYTGFIVETRRTPGVRDIIRLLCILTGALLIINSRGNA